MTPYQRGSSFATPVVLNLLIFNFLFFMSTIIAQQRGIDFFSLFGLPWIKSENFRLWQMVTYMFMHANWLHIFFNMFALWMFGNMLEMVMGSKRFITYYFITGIGAALVQWFIHYLRYHGLDNAIDAYIQNPDPDVFLYIANKYFGRIANPQYINEMYTQLKLFSHEEILVNQSIEVLQQLRNGLYDIPMVGASGAVFGILLAYGMIFPNDYVYVYFFIPMKAKYFVILFGVLEFFLGISNRGGDNVAHFAHLGGMLFGLILLLIWKKRR
ncbi:MAG: rhomboid family intramembrane serine protease [Bacteroidales bacterium]|nr:rhomboid family intramembrane serine protease [Bacteroidales bacterium]